LHPRKLIAKGHYVADRSRRELIADVLDFGLEPVTVGSTEYDGPFSRLLSAFVNLAGVLESVSHRFFAQDVNTRVERNARQGKMERRRSAHADDIRSII
jgi:hypothetical protein